MWDIKIQIIFFQPNWTEETFVTKKVKDATPWVYVIGIYGYINGEETTGTFYEQELQKNITRVQNWKSNKEKGDKLYVKWKRYDHSFDSRINKPDIKWISLNIFLNRIVHVNT